MSGKEEVGEREGEKGRSGGVGWNSNSAFFFLITSKTIPDYTVPNL